VTAYARWERDGWRGVARPALELDVAAVARMVDGAGRASRHARTLPVTAAGERLFVKLYPAPAGWRARQAFRASRMLVAAGFGAPETVLVARRGAAGVLVSRDVGGEDLAEAVGRLGAGREPAARQAKRRLLRLLGAEVARLHAAGFVHGDLVPPNVRVSGDRLVFLDNDRTRRSRLLVAVGARRNLVQLGRFVVPGVTLTDRARVLDAYARGRRLSRRRRLRLARWLVAKTTARRCAIDRIPEATARQNGFRELMRSGGPFDPAGTGRRSA